MPTHHGSCLCGGIKFEIDGPLVAPSNCHCMTCRKQHEARFAAVLGHHIPGKPGMSRFHPLAPIGVAPANDWKGAL